MEKLAFPPFDFKIKSKENTYLIFDIIRKKWILLTPEEWVRQHSVHFLIEQKKAIPSCMAVEKQIELPGNVMKRYDIVVFTANAEIALLVECKSPKVSINQHTFDQIAQYNSALKSKFLMLTNGLHHYFCQMDFKNQTYRFIDELPVFEK